MDDKKRDSSDELKEEQLAEAAVGIYIEHLNNKY